MTTRVNITVELDNPDLIARAVETLTRAAVGIALEGVDVFVSVCPVTEDETADESTAE